MLRLLLLALLALAPLPAVASTVRVVATVPSLAAIVQEVGGAEVKVTSLSLHTQDPHWVDARPNLALELSRADLLLAVGLDLEIGWLPVLQEGSRNPKIQTGAQGWLDVSTFVNVLDVPTTKIERSEGDLHPGGNPHYLHDPRAAESIAYGIARKLGELDPEHANYFNARAQAFAVHLGEHLSDWEHRLRPLHDRKLVAYHKSWPYLQDWLHFDIVEYIEPKPGIPPNPAHVARVLSTMRQQEVGMIIQMAYYNDGTVQQVSERTGARVVRIPGGVDYTGGQTYFQHMEEIVALLEGAM